MYCAVCNFNKFKLRGPKNAVVSTIEFISIFLLDPDLFINFHDWFTCVQNMLFSYAIVHVDRFPLAEISPLDDVKSVFGLRYVSTYVPIRLQLNKLRNSDRN